MKSTGTLGGLPHAPSRCARRDRRPSHHLACGDAELAEATLNLSGEVATVARDNLKAIKANVIAALSLAPEGELGW